MPFIARCRDCGADHVHDAFVKAWWRFVWDHVANQMECVCPTCAGVVVKEKKARRK